MRPTLSASRVATYQECPRRYAFKYINRLEPEDSGEARHAGLSIHAALEAIAQGRDWTEVVHALAERYPDDSLDQRARLEVLLRLCAAYQWRYQHEGLEYLATELEIKLPLAYREQDRVARLDAIVRTVNGEVLVLDHKLVSGSTSLADESDYWDRLRLDNQMSGYIAAARHAGYECSGFLYDVIRKPTSKPIRIPSIKALAEIIETGLYYREPVPEGWIIGAKAWIGSKERKGPPAVVEAPEMYGARILTDMVTDPERYFARRLVYRTQRDIDAYEHDLAAVSDLLEHSHDRGAWPANPNSCSVPYRCDYAALCARGLTPCSLRDTPEGYRTR